MATTSSTSSSATAASSAQSLITSLGAGSGVDVKSLAQNLVDAEKTPQANLINDKISKCEAKISGYSAINYILSDLQTKFGALNTAGGFASITASNNQPSAFSVTTTADAAVASHSINVSRIATGQRSITSSGYGAPSSTLPSGATVQITLAGTALPAVTVPANATVAQLASAINNQLGSKGINAQLVNKGAAAADPSKPYHLVLSGPTGAKNSFTVSGLPMDQQSTTGLASATSNLPDYVSVTVGNQTLNLSPSDTLSGLAGMINQQFGLQGYSAKVVNQGSAAKDPANPYVLTLSGPNGDASGMSITGLAMGSATLQNPQDAVLNVDGVDIRSASNTVSDAISGVTLNLTNTTNGSATLDLSRDVSALKTKLNDLVTSFNDTNTVLTNTADPKSQVSGYGASLVGDSTVGSVRSQIRNLFIGKSSTPGNSIATLQDLGFTIDRYGKMSLDDSKLTKVLQSNFDDVVKMMCNSRTTPTLLTSVHAGTAGDAVKKLTDMLATTATLSTQSQNAQTQINKYKNDLSKLDDRMSQMLDRYTKQFAAMDSLVGQINSQKTSLKSTFDGMMASLKG